MLMLCSSIGFTVSKHFCGGELVKSSLGFVKEDLSCGMNQMENVCPIKGESMTSNCCENGYEYCHLKDQVKKESSEIRSLLDFAYRGNNRINEKNHTLLAQEETNYYPPQIYVNIKIEYQVFRI